LATLKTETPRLLACCKRHLKIGSNCPPQQQQKQEQQAATKFFPKIQKNREEKITRATTQIKFERKSNYKV